MRSRPVVVLALFCLAIAGCEPELYRAETRLLPDGTIERAISQPYEKRIPAAAQEKAAGWLEVFKTPPIKRGKDQELPIRELPASLGQIPKRLGRAAEQPGSFVAWGAFASVDQIPDHFEICPIDGGPKSRLVRKLVRTELGFVTEWRWTEVLTDVVDLTDHRRARTEFARQAVKLGIAAAKEAWGPEYDLQELEHWLSTELTEAFHEFCELVLELGIQKQIRNFQGNEPRFDAILKRHGLNLWDESGKRYPNPQERIDLFWTTLIEKLVKDKQGQPLSKAKLDDLLKTITFDGKHDTKLFKAWEKVIVGEYGSEDQFGLAFHKIAFRIFGIHLFTIFMPEWTFDYKLELPGTVIQTTGELLNTNLVRWKFNTVDAFPLGYSMEAVSVAINADAARKHLPADKLKTHEQLTQYLKLVRGHPDLIEALNEFAQKGDSTQYDTWRKSNLRAIKSKEVSTHAKDVQVVLGR